jgi:hypothetical protein
VIDAVFHANRSPFTLTSARPELLQRLCRSASNAWPSCVETLTVRTPADAACLGSCVQQKLVTLGAACHTLVDGAECAIPFYSGDALFVAPMRYKASSFDDCEQSR